MTIPDTLEQIFDQPLSNPADQRARQRWRRAGETIDRDKGFGIVAALGVIERHGYKVEWSEVKVLKKMERLDNNDIKDKFYELEDSQKVNVLYAALDEMQTFNGRTKIECIALAMGFTIDFIDGKTVFVK